MIMISSIQFIPPSGASERLTSIKIGNPDKMTWSCNAWNMQLPDATNARIQIGLYFLLLWVIFMGSLAIHYMVDFYWLLGIVEVADVDEAEVIAFSEDLTEEQQERCVEVQLVIRVVFFTLSEFYLPSHHGGCKILSVPSRIGVRCGVSSLRGGWPGDVGG